MTDETKEEIKLPEKPKEAIKKKEEEFIVYVFSKHNDNFLIKKQYNKELRILPKNLFKNVGRFLITKSDYDKLEVYRKGK